jgi:methyl-accepting chemotaxis protein
MINIILQGTQNAVSGMHTGSAQVTEGVRMVARTGESMSHIENSTKRVLVAVEDISTALHEQTSACSLIAENVEQIAQMTDENGAAVNAVSRAANQLEALAAQLQVSVGRFAV